MIGSTIHLPTSVFRRGLSRGFTLIELLVVISIVSLLVALTLPALKNARVAAVRAGCMSNARQSIIAIQAYAADYREFPFNMDPADTAVNVTLYPDYSFMRAPWSFGSEGNKSHWRSWLVQLGYTASPDGLGCADSLSGKPASVVMASAQGANNFRETSAEVRKAPPYFYLGPGVDVVRAAGYNTGILGAAGTWGDNGRSRAGRSFRWLRRHPLLICPYFRQGANLTGVPIFAPHSAGVGFNGGQMDWSDRAVDQHVAWTDGAVQLLFGRAAGSTGVAVYFPLPNYNWMQH